MDLTLIDEPIERFRVIIGFAVLEFICICLILGRDFLRAWRDVGRDRWARAQLSLAASLVILIGIWSIVLFARVMRTEFMPPQWLASTLYYSIAVVPVVALAIALRKGLIITRGARE